MRRSFAGAAAFILTLIAAFGATQDPQIALIKTPDGQAFEVTGLASRQVSIDPATLPKLVRVFVVSDEHVPPILGTYGVTADSIRFIPRFPLQPGVAYRVEFRPALLPGSDPDHEEIVKTFEIPRETVSKTLVTAVFPTMDRLPENLLKFYVHFSSPMRRGEVYSNVRLERADSGEAVDLPFLEISEELWDPELRRLTLLFDPGRIKRELLPNRESGTALVAGTDYRLIISRELRDAEGNTLVGDFVKEFRVVAPDRAAPRVSDWKIIAPAAGTLDPVRVLFPEPMDRALLERLLTIVDRSEQPVRGQVEIGMEETMWSFTPAATWRAVRYQLLVTTTLEDLAGNTIDRLFDVDVFEKVEDRITQTQIRLPLDLTGQ